MVRNENYLWFRSAVPKLFLAPGTDFMEDSFYTDQGWGQGDGFRMIQAHYILHFISNLMLLLIRQEVLGCSLELRDPWFRDFDSLTPLIINLHSYLKNRHNHRVYSFLHASISQSVAQPSLGGP